MYFDALVGGSLCFVGMKEMLNHIDSYHSEAMQVASIAKKIQHEMFDHDGFMLVMSMCLTERLSPKIAPLH